MTHKNKTKNCIVNKRIVKLISEKKPKTGVPEINKPTVEVIFNAPRNKTTDKKKKQNFTVEKIRRFATRQRPGISQKREHKEGRNDSFGLPRVYPRCKASRRQLLTLGSADINSPREVIFFNEFLYD